MGKLDAEDIRFTRNQANSVVYALVLGWPVGQIIVRALGLAASTQPGKIAKVELLGTGATLNSNQLPDGLRVELPKQYRPVVDYAAALKLTMA